MKTETLYIVESFDGTKTAYATESAAIDRVNASPDLCEYLGPVEFETL